MSVRTVLVQVEPDPERTAAVRAAADLAGRFEAVLLGVGAAAMDALLQPAARYMEPAVLASLRGEVRDELARAEAVFRAAVGDACPVEWRGVAEASPVQAMIRSAAAADLVVAARPAGSRALADPGALAMEAGLPLLLAPAGAERLDGSVALVAWKDGAEARRAVGDALPFLKAAKRVVLAAVQEGAEGPAKGVGDVVGRLARHGIEAEVQSAEAGFGLAGEVLLGLAEREGADLIVAGAYAHSRVQEWVFGGVTDTLLRRAPQFVLFSR